MKKIKRTYPLTAAVAMGASGTRCPQIIENPCDRRIPETVSLIEGEYILMYSDYLEEIFCTKRDELFALHMRDRPTSIVLSPEMEVYICKNKFEALSNTYVAMTEGRKKLWGLPFHTENFVKTKHIVFIFGQRWARGGYVPPMEKSYLVGEHGPEPIVPRHIGIDLARPGSERTVITITNPGGGGERLREMYEAEARKKIAKAFQIPEEFIMRDGRKFIYDKSGSQKPEERVYDASAWTGRKPCKSSPDLTPVEAWAEFEAVILKEIEALFEWFRSWTVREYYFDDERILRHKTSLVLALRRKDRDIIRRHIELRNGVRKVESAFLEIGKAVRSAARSFIRLNRQLKKD